MAYDLNLISSVNIIDLNVSNTAYGGIKVRMMRDGFIDDFAQRTENEYDLTRLYEDVQGSISFKIEGPTASGILKFLREIDYILDRGKKYTERGYRFPLYLQDTSGLQAYIKEARLILPQTISRLQTQKSIPNIKIEYIRRGIVGTPINSTPDATNIQTGFRTNDVPQILTMPALTNISSPMDMDIKFFNQRETFPSGILLLTNDTNLLVTMSGQVFNSNNGSVYSPSQIRLFNEDANGAYSTFNSFSTGVLGFTPTTLNPVTTSGNINIEGILSTNTFTSNKADFYGTFRTTFSGLRVTVQVIGRQDENIYLQTDPIEIPYSPNPTPYYLGSFYAQSILADTRLFLKFTPNVASGTLLMDRFISHGVPDENGRAIQIQGFQKETTIASGNNYLRFISNYFPNLSTAGGIYPTLFARREESGTDKWIDAPAYRGNIMLFTKESDTLERFPVHNSTANILKLLYLATGHAIPASGIKWVHQDVNNQRTRIVTTALMMQDTSNLFLPTE